MTFILYDHFNGKPDERLIPPSGFYSTNNGYGNPNVRTKKVAIWALVTEASGQKLSPPQPVVIPKAANCLIQAAAQWSVETSLNPVLSPTGSGS